MDELKGVSEYVDFSGTGEMAAFASATLEGGTDTVDGSGNSGISDFLDKSEKVRFNCMCFPSTESSLQTALLTKIKYIRESIGWKCQAVAPNFAADYEGIINLVNSFVYGDRSLTTAEACAWLAGATAGADYVTSLTYAQVTNATSVVGEMNNEASIAAIEAGQTFFSVDDEGNVILEYDINSKVHIDSETPQDIKKNRPLRVYDSFENDCLITFRPGKFDNDEDGWAVVEGLGRSMLQNYSDDGALTNVVLDEDFLVDTGRSVGDSMYLNIGLQAVDKYYIFYVYEPKKRMIMSITFYHRIVQWAIYRVINPLLVKGYIKDTYGCIPGRGSLAAMQRLRYWIKSVEHKPGTWYYLKLDISKYFYRISHEVLKEILARKIKDQQLLQVLYNIIDCQHTPFGLPPGKGPGEVPLEERLYDVGMPVGNLLSQVFANIYLDALDQFCKRTLCIHFYVRYMDDIIILSDSKEKLHMWKDEIQKFVETTLRLSLNQKTCIRPISQGIEFVGYRIWPHYVTIRKSTTLEMKRHLRRKVEEYNAGLIEMEVVTATLKSYLGMLDHCDCKEFRKELIDSVVLDRNKVVGEIAYEVENYSEAMVCGL